MESVGVADREHGDRFEGSGCFNRDEISLHLGICKSSVYRRTAEMVHCRLPVTEHPLGHSDEDKVVCRIDPEPGSGGPLPVKCALADDLVGGWRVVVHGKVVAPSMSRPHHGLSDRELAGQ